MSLGGCGREGVSYLPWGPRPTSLAILPKVSLPEDLSSSNPSSGTEEGAEFRTQAPAPPGGEGGSREGLLFSQGNFLMGACHSQYGHQVEHKPYKWLHLDASWNPRGQVGIPGNWQPRRGPQRALHLFSKHFLSILPRSRPF